MISRIAALPLLLAGLAPAQVTLQLPTGGQGVAFNSVLTLTNGDQLLVGAHSVASITGGTRQAIALTAVGPVPFESGVPGENFPILGGNGDDEPAAAAVDPQGNIWIVGSTNSDDFNLVNPIVSQKVPYRRAGFVIEIDPTGANLLFATYLCGHQANSYNASSYANQIVFDSAGNAYVAGATDELDFPLTPGAFLTKGGGADTLNIYFYAFVMKISSAGKLVYSTLLGGSYNGCIVGSACVQQQSTYTVVDGMAVDASGNLTLSGITNTINFPVTAGAFQPSDNSAPPFTPGFVARLASDGSRLLWSTYVPAGAMLGITLAPAQGTGVTYLGMAQDAQGNVSLFGKYILYTDYLQVPNAVAAGLFAARLNSDGSTLIHSLDLGQSPDAAAYGIVLDSAGNEYLTGTSSSAQFPSLPGVPNLGADFILRLNASGSPQNLVRLPAGTLSGPPAFDPPGNLLLISGQIGLLQLPAGSALSAPAVIGYSNAASFAVNRGLWPGALISLFGWGLASAPQVGAADASGHFPTALGGVRVTVNGTPAPLLYVAPDQINLQVPFDTGGNYGYGAQQLQVTTPSATLTTQFPMTPSLGLFMIDGGPLAAALNQDGTINSAANPAAQGSIVTLFGTGASWGSGLSDGALAPAAAPLSQFTNQFQVQANGVYASILYAGAAPTLIDGVFQLNVQLPIGVTVPMNGRVSLTLTGDASGFGAVAPSNTVQIYCQ